MGDKIEENIGSEKFKSERYLREIRLGRIGNKKEQRIYNAHSKSTGGFISGEIKLLLTLRLLAGGSYLDLSLLLEVGFHYSFDIFHDVVENWINDDNIVNINGEEYLNDEERLAAVADEFRSRSNGLITGAICAVDGWLVKISKPSVSDGITNSGSFFSRKGFYALNIQVVCDRKKRALYRSMRCRGAEHDSSYVNEYKTQIIDSCIRLHNFIVDFCERKQEPTPLQQMEREVFEDETERFLAVNRDLINYGVFGGEQETQAGGRPSRDDVSSRRIGVAIRCALKTLIERNRFIRPATNWFRKNNRFLYEDE